LEQEVENCKKYPQNPMYSGLLLVNTNGKPLWYAYVADGKTRKNTSIADAFEKLIKKLRTSHSDMPTITYNQFRRTSATLIDNERQYKMFNGLWLAHASRSMADKHYNTDDDTVLDECVAWLHDKIFGEESLSKRGNVKMGCMGYDWATFRVWARV